jgi:hypothetical protein
MKKALLALVVVASASAVAEAQVKNRWRLQWSNDKPQIYTYRAPNDTYENFWFFTYTLENTSDEIIPLIVDIQLYTESGKELQNDFRKIDPPIIKEELANPRKSEALKYGRFYANVIDPEAEYKIIEYHAKIGNRADGIVRESIEAFKKGFTEDPPEEFKGRWKKGDRMYLNPREMREARVIQPGQKIHGIAIFKNVDPRAHIYEIHVSGLVDIVKITAVNEDEWKMEYEPQTLKIRYERQGDPFEIERDVLYRMAKKEYVVKKIGPIASKDTIDRLVNGLADTLKKELEWKEKDLKPEEIAKKREADGIEPLDTRVMAEVFRLATDKNFGYDPTKDVLENEKAVWRIHEWWITNRSKLIFNEITNRFEVKDDPLPGTVDK